METNTRSIATLRQLLDHNARHFTSGEVQLSNSLQSWILTTGSLQLKMILQKYLDFVDQQVKKMDSFFSEEEIPSISIHNRVMHAYIEETNEKLAACTDMEVKDACLLACIQAINHFKISTYGTAAAFAQVLGMESQAALFHEALIREKQIDDRLTQLAAYEINNRAKAPVALPR